MLTGRSDLGTRSYRIENVVGQVLAPVTIGQYLSVKTKRVPIILAALIGGHGVLPALTLGTPSR